MQSMKFMVNRYVKTFAYPYWTNVFLLYGVEEENFKYFLYRILYCERNHVTLTKIVSIVAQEVCCNKIARLEPNGHTKEVK